MRALSFSEYGAADVLTIVDVAIPEPGPGEIRIAVRASGVTPADWYLRSGRLRERLPLTLPHLLGVDAAGVVDKVGPGVGVGVASAPAGDAVDVGGFEGVSVGDEVFGITDIARLGGANAEYAVLAGWAPKPASWSWEQAGGAGANIETATRVLDRLDVGAHTTLLIDGAAGGVGTMAVQLAVARGARVIGTASPRNHEFLASLGATGVAYGPGLRDRVPDTVDAVMDCVGSGSLPDLIAIAGGPGRVVTVADFSAEAHGVHMSRTGGGPGADPSSWYGLGVAVELADRGLLSVPVAGVFALPDAATAHRLSETGHARGKIVLVP